MVVEGGHVSSILISLSLFTFASIFKPLQALTNDGIAHAILQFPDSVAFPGASGAGQRPARSPVNLGRLKALGFGHGRVHAFRHAIADFLANDPAMTLPQVHEFLGHSNIQTTMIDVHTHAKNAQHALRGVHFGRLSAPPSATEDKAPPRPPQRNQSLKTALRVPDPSPAPRAAQ